MFLHTVNSYSNAVYECLRFGTVKSDSSCMYDLAIFFHFPYLLCYCLSVVSQHDYQYIQSCLLP